MVGIVFMLAFSLLKGSEETQAFSRQVESFTAFMGEGIGAVSGTYAAGRRFVF
jgi:hypothetical protein